MGETPGEEEKAEVSPKKPQTFKKEFGLFSICNTILYSSQTHGGARP